MQDVLRFLRMLALFIGGIGAGILVINLIEAYMHNVPLFDAMFIESWKKGP